MANTVTTTFHSVNAIVIRDDTQSGSQHIFLQRDPFGLFTLQYILSTFEHPDRVESTVVQSTDLQFLIFFDRELQETRREQGIYVFIGLDENNQLFDLHPEHHLMQVALAMESYVLFSL